MRCLPALLLLFAGAGSSAQQAPREDAILIYSGTTGYRHDSIPAGIAAIRRLAQARGLVVEASEDPAVFAAGGLSRYRALVLLSSTTDPKRPESEWLTEGRREGLKRFVQSGGGVLAVHAAADSHYHWPWYGRLIGGRFARHPDGTPRGRVELTTRTHPANRGLAASVERTDEWYYFDDYDPRSTLLATLDPASIGEKDVNANPVAWTRTEGRGRVFYTAMGHTSESYSEPWFVHHLGNGLDWALGGRRGRAR